MRTLSSIVVSLLLSITGFSYAASLCTKDEQVLFSCNTNSGRKIASLCGSATLSRREGYIQYRFGQPGKLELEFPEYKKGSQERFYYSDYVRYQVFRMSVRFENGGYRYEIYHSYEGDLGPPEVDSGIDVTGHGKSISLKCTGEPEGEYHLLGESLPCDPESPWGDKSCN